MSKKIIAHMDTWLKKSTESSTKLRDDQKVWIPKYRELTIKSYRKAPDNHLEVELAYSAGTWFIFETHWFVIGETVVEWDNNQDAVSKYFTVGEVTRYDARRIPETEEIKKRIITLATELDKVREAWGHPIIVTSWYRPPSINRSVGGARNSRHLYGDAVDIKPSSGSLHRFQSWLDANWYGALGYGAKKGFVHLDMRNGKGWQSGGEKGVRWNY